jgi:small multidrug resistance pump
MAWIYLLLAILFEIAGTTALRISDGFSKLLPSIAMVVFYALSFGALSLTLKRIDVGVAYAVWSALGTALIATIGVLWFHEPR